MTCSVYIYICMYIYRNVNSYLWRWVLNDLFVYAQLRVTLCGPMDCSLLGSSVHGILQGRILQ